jgi:hypothetical protein
MTLLTYNEKQLSDMETAIDVALENPKTPVKITDEAGKIKKVLIHQSAFFSTSSSINYYFKFPIVNVTEENAKPIVEFNFRLGNNSNSNYCYSLFKATIYQNAVDNLTCTLDNTHNYSKFSINTRKLVYYTDAEEINHYYLKLTFTNTGLTNVTYLDVSTDSVIPDAFSFENMFVTSLPGTEVDVPNQSVNMENPHILAMQKNGSYSLGLISNNYTSNPTNTHPYIYGGMPGTWGYSTISGTSWYILSVISNEGEEEGDNPLMVVP